MSDLAARARRDPALVKRLMASGRSYQLPSSMLSVAQRRARSNAQAQKAISDPTKPLSGVNLTTFAHQINDGQYAPQLADLARQQTEAQGREAQGHKTTSSIYDTINRYQTAALGAQNAQQASGASALAGITNGASAQVDAAAEQQRAQAAKDAQVRGAGLDGGALDALAARTVEAKSNIAQRGQIAGDALAANAQTNNAVLGGIGAATQQRGTEQQAQLRTATQDTLKKIASDRSAALGKQGSTFADTLRLLRQQATDEYYTAAGLGLKATTEADNTAAKAASLKSTASNQKASRDAQAKKWGRTVNKYGVTNAAWYQWGKTDSGKAKRQAAIEASRSGKGGKGGRGKKGGPGSATDTEQGRAYDAIAAAAHLVETNRQGGHDRQGIEQTLLQGQAANAKTGDKAIKPVPAAYLQAALDLIFNDGKLSKATVDLLHAQGLSVNALNLGQLAQQIGAGRVTTALGPQLAPLINGTG